MADCNQEKNRKRGLRTRGIALLLTAGLALLNGCAGPGQSDTGLWDLSRLKFWDRQDDDLTSIDNVQGPLERLLRSNRNLRDEYSQSIAPPQGQQEFSEAMALFNENDFGSARRAFKRVARNYEDTPLEEDALFYIGECDYATGHYASAQDSYDALLKRYPSPRNLDTVAKHLFDIARNWLQFPAPVESSEIQQVSLDDKPARQQLAEPLPPSRDPSRIIPIVPNLWDRSRPVFDTDGRALQALRTIWLNDPTGPLADDALMMAASHHLRDANYMEADRLYTIIREDYPKSPHLENAFVLGSHVKLMSYQGANYDATSLAEAQKLKESALRLYPKNPQRERILDEIRRLEEEKAAQEWANVIFWQKKNDPNAVAVSCREVIRLFPNSSYAGRAREVLSAMSGQ